MAYRPGTRQTQFPKGAGAPHSGHLVPGGDRWEAEQRGNCEGHFRGSTGPGNCPRLRDGCIADTVLSTSQCQALCLAVCGPHADPHRWTATSFPFPREGVEAERGGDWLRGTVHLTHSPCQDEDGEAEVEGTASATVPDTRCRTWTPPCPTGFRATPASRGDRGGGMGC